MGIIDKKKKAVPASPFVNITRLKYCKLSSMEGYEHVFLRIVELYYTSLSIQG